MSTAAIVILFLLALGIIAAAQRPDPDDLKEITGRLDALEWRLEEGLREIQQAIEDLKPTPLPLDIDD